jgi:hypothetical protein
MNPTRQRTEREELALLDEIHAFNEELRSAVARMPHGQANDRWGVSTAAPKLLLDSSLNWVKSFLLRKAKTQPQTPEATSEEAYALWLFSSYLAHHQGMTLLETDFDALFEFFFWWYPRQCESASEPLTERLFASLREMFAFLVEEGELSGDEAVRDFWPLEDSAVRLLALYEQLNPESAYFEEQFEALFGLQPPED